MIVAVASGKGGTGKTTVAASLALVAAEKGPVQYLDCDVEEPNGHLLLHPAWEHRRAVTVPVPVIDRDKCNFCGRCAQICAFHALAVLPDEVLVFPELCHGCGGCQYFCPMKAITENKREIGCVETGQSGAIQFVHGCLQVGEAICTPLIGAVKEQAAPGTLTILDAPPGTSCPVIKTVTNAGFCILVTEPTPFGLHDLRLAVKMVKKLGIPCGIIINRSDGQDQLIVEFSRDMHIPVLFRLPEDRMVAEGYAGGMPAVTVRPAWKPLFQNLLDGLEAGKQCVS
ncbi:P-loop NTPase [Desulfotomaculum copahuensis]|uniref:(4Fe-4S)-binding protein n=1 Tax=Desulfotomaculum copahuensis TaxID=1838280 RepID=A0A1B7LB05_9FIRM|nr:ATP-binding protein [Desulfotomaculum copahuensis]OAT79522.1 (4Fe-4S)-binding protein [Desulfotomaculum copahuensis]